MRTRKRANKFSFLSLDWGQIARVNSNAPAATARRCESASNNESSDHLTGVIGARAAGEMEPRSFVRKDRALGIERERDLEKARSHSR
jgi:hypothetical protein